MKKATKKTKTSASKRLARRKKINKVKPLAVNAYLQFGGTRGADRLINKLKTIPVGGDSCPVPHHLSVSEDKMWEDLGFFRIPASNSKPPISNL